MLTTNNLTCIQPQPQPRPFELSAEERGDLCKWLNGLHPLLLRAASEHGVREAPNVALAAFDEYAEYAIWDPARRESLRQIFESAIEDVVRRSELLSIGCKSN